MKNLLQEEGLCSERLRIERWEETDRSYRRCRKEEAMGGGPKAKAGEGALRCGAKPVAPTGSEQE